MPSSWVTANSRGVSRAWRSDVIVDAVLVDKMPVPSSVVADVSVVGGAGTTTGVIWGESVVCGIQKYTHRITRETRIRRGIVFIVTVYPFSTSCQCLK